MGWDCTLHVVDEAALARFADRLLGRSKKKHAFDDAVEGGAALFARTRELLAANDAESAARAVGELALLWVSAETPHVYSRGFAISLWDERAMGAKMPPHLGSVEALLRDVVAKHPPIAGRIPTFFDQNYCVGPFVRAKDVPSVLAHVERAIDAMVPGDREPYLGLRRVLRAAAARGMAYWEGTDLGVVQANEQWLEEKSSKSRKPFARASFRSVLARPVAREGTRFLVTDDWVTHVVDVAEFPPRVTSYDGLQTFAGAFVKGELVLWSATDPSQRPYVFSLYTMRDGSLARIDAQPPWRLHTIRSCLGAALLFADPYEVRQRTDLAPLVLRGARIERLSAARPRGRLNSIKSVTLDCDAIELDGETAFVVWDGLPHLWDGGKKLAPLPGKKQLDPGGGLPSAVVLEDGSLATIYGRKPVRISRDGSRKTILPLDNVMEVIAGPDGALVFDEGNNVEADALKIWWPRTKEVTQIELDDDPSFVLPAPDGLVVLAAGRWHAMTWAELAALPRVAEAKFLERHQKLVARKTKRKR